MTRSRAAFLRDFGALYTIIGALWIAIPTKGREAAIAWLPGIISQEVVALLWLTAGIFAMGIGWLSRNNAEGAGIGFAGLQAVPAILGFYFACAWLVHILPPAGDGGSPTGIVTTASYAGLWYAARWAAQTGAGVEHDGGPAE